MSRFHQQTDRPLSILPWRRAVFALLIIGFLTQAAAGSRDWVQWRGQDLDGKTTSKLDLSALPGLAFELVYRKPLGSSYACISVKGNTAVTMASQGDGDYVIAFAAENGDLLWRYRLEDFFQGEHGADDGPLSTPTIDQDRVYALSARGLLVALSLKTGELLWRCDLPTRFGSQPGRYGYSTVPLVFEDKVLIAAGGKEGRTLAAIDRETGKTLWTAGIEDRVVYHNPILLKLLGQTQCVIPTLNNIISIDPKTGKKLWQYKTENRANDCQIIAIDDTRFAAASPSNVKLFQLSGEPGRFQVTRLWKSLAFKRTHGTPVLFDNHLYGFNGYFLSCVDIETGKATWKSRPPGGQNLIAVDQTLLFWDSSGSLAAVKATPEGYREITRLKLSEQTRTYSPPSFANGHIFLRDLKYVYKVRPSSLSQKDLTQHQTPKPVGIMADFHRKLSHGNTLNTVADFLSRHTSWPIRDQNWVHFLFQGKKTDLAIVGDMTGGHLQDPMISIQGTDLYYRSYAMEPGHRWEYQFVEFEEKFADPRNANKVTTPEGERSVFADRGWKNFQPSPNHTAQQTGALIPITIPDPNADTPLQLTVYLPPGHQPTDTALPFLIVARGKEAIEYGKFHKVMDDRVARGKKPIALVFLQLPASAFYSTSTQVTFNWLDRLILPELEKRFPFSKDRKDRGWLVQDWSATTVLRYLLGHNQQFGMFGVQSLCNGPYYQRNFLDPKIADLPTTRFVFDWGTYDQYNPNYFLDVAKSSAEMARYFEQKGHPVITKPGPGGFGWIAWQARLDGLLDALVEAASP